MNMTIKNSLASALTGLALIAGGTFAFQMTTGESASAQIQINAQSAKDIVDDAIDAGIVGETAAGYLALTGGSIPEKTLNAMNEINSSRKAVYTELARNKGTQVEIVAALRGEKQLAGAKPGTKVLTKEGKWITVR